MKYVLIYKVRRQKKLSNSCKACYRLMETIFLFDSLSIKNVYRVRNHFSLKCFYLNGGKNRRKLFMTCYILQLFPHFTFSKKLSLQSLQNHIYCNICGFSSCTEYCFIKFYRFYFIASCNAIRNVENIEYYEPLLI